MFYVFFSLFDLFSHTGPCAHLIFSDIFDVLEDQVEEACFLYYNGAVLCRRHSSMGGPAYSSPARVGVLLL